jgi:hypothetical protein
VLPIQPRSPAEFQLKVLQEIGDELIKGLGADAKV